MGCLRPNINAALMDGLKSDFLQQCVGWKPAGLGSESEMVGRCLQTLLASADGAQLINAFPIRETLKGMFFQSTV